MSNENIDTEAGNAVDLLQDLIARARRAGADAADAVLFEGVSLSHARRLGKTEKLERSEGQDLGLRVFIGHQQAIVSSTDRSPEALGELILRGGGVLDDIVQDGRHDGICIQAQVREDGGRGDRVSDVGLTREALLALVNRGAELGGLADAPDLLGRQVAVNGTE